MNSFIEKQFELLPKLLLEKLPKIPLKNSQLIIFVGSGSSLNAAAMADRYFHTLTNKETRYYTPNVYQDLLAELPRHLLIAISQTSSSLATLESLRQSRAADNLTILISATTDKKKRAIADFFIDLYCPEETIGPKTLGFTATFIRLIQIAAALGDNRALPKLTQDIQECLMAMPALKLRTEAWVHEHRDWAELSYLTIAADYSLKGLIDEGALKLLETLRIPVIGYEISEFTHGPHRLIHEDSFHIFIGSGYTEMLAKKICRYAGQFTEHICYLSLNESDIPLGISEKKAGYELLYSLIFQVLANRFALVSGFNPASKIHETFFKYIGTKD